MARVDLRSGEGWFRVWLVASAIWVAAVAFKAAIQEDSYDAYMQKWSEAFLEAPHSKFSRPLPPKTRSQWAWDIFWRNALVAIGPPVAVPAIVVWALWMGQGGIVVGRWVKSGFEPKDEP